MKLTIILICLFVSAVSCAHLSKRQANINNLDNIQALLQELEKANANANINNGNSIKGSDTPVRDSLARLFGAFQEMARAYVNVLTSVGKSVGVPIPNIVPKSSVEYLQAEGSVGAVQPAQTVEPANNQPIIIKQVNENIRQLQESAQEVSKNFNNMITRQGPVDNFILLNEMSKFVRLWSNQVRDISEQITRGFGGLEAEDADFRGLQDTLAQQLKNFQNMFNQVMDNLAKSINPPKPDEQTTPAPIPSGPGREDAPSLDLIKEFKNLLEAFQKRMKALTQQLESVANTGSTNSNQLPVEHRDKPKN